MEEELQRDLLQQMRDEPGMTATLALATVGASSSQLQRWREQDVAFAAQWAVIAADRNGNGSTKLQKPRQATAAACHRVIADFEVAPELGLTAHCRAAGTTVRKFEAALEVNPQLDDLYEYAKQALVAPLEQVHIASLATPGNVRERGKFLGRNGPELYGDSAETVPPVPVSVNVNLAVLQAGQQAPQLEDGSFWPADISLKKRHADDKLPSMFSESDHG